MKGEQSPAYLLGEGDTLPGGERVLTIHRDPVNRTVLFTTTGRRSVTAKWDQLVHVVARAR